MPSRSKSSQLHAAAAEARASATPLDPTASPERPARLAALSALQSELSALENAFVPPPPGALTFQPNNPAKLAFTAANAPVLAHEDALVKLLTKLDGVESDGDPVVRAERKRVVNAVDHELERLDGLKKAEVERAAGRGHKEDELREKRERVDKMLRDAANAAAKGEHKATAHEVAENALYNEHGKRVEHARGRGSPRSGDEDAAHPGLAPSPDRYVKNRRHASPTPASKPLPPSPAPQLSNSGHSINPTRPNFFAALPSKFDPR